MSDSINQTEQLPGETGPSLTHVDESGSVRMVDVGDKNVTQRRAVARSSVRARLETVEAIRAQAIAKGDVVAVARIAGIMAAKRTSDLIPLCHPIPISSVHLDIELRTEEIITTATVSCSGQTGVEMEALTAASVAALTIYDMCKAIDRGMTIGDVRLVEKTGGRSGVWKPPED